VNKPDHVVAVVIVTYNSADCIGASLAALCESKIVVVDNASTDGTTDLVERDFPRVRLIRNTQNVYYAAACNQGAAATDGDYILFLNPDVQLAESALGRLLSFLENNRDVAAVAPRLLYPDGSVQRSVRSFPSYAILWYELLGLSCLFPRHGVFGRWRMNLDGVDHPIDVDQPMASCLLIRRDVWDTLDGFDERFPMFFNDVDLCYRIKKSGGRIAYLLEVMAVHHLGSSVRPVMAKMVWFSHLGFLRFLRKHHRTALDLLRYALTAPVVLLAAGIRSAFWLCRGRV
jgi:GT2 family glycosyltransferase